MKNSPVTMGTAVVVKTGARHHVVADRRGMAVVEVTLDGQRTLRIESPGEQGLPVRPPTR